MDKILSPIKERLLKYLEISSISRESFYRQTGLSASNFKGSGLYSALGSDKIGTILTLYPDLNSEWLMTGRGAMRLPSQTVYPSVEETLTSNLSDAETPNYQTAEPTSDLGTVPLYDFSLSMGLTALTAANKVPTGRISLPGLENCDGALRCTDDSLLPLFGRGDIALYRCVHSIPEGLIPDAPHLLAFAIGAEEQTVLRYVRRGKDSRHIRLESLNPQLLPTEILVSEIHAAAFVCAGVRYNTPR